MEDVAKLAQCVRAGSSFRARLPRSLDIGQPVVTNVVHPQKATPYGGLVLDECALRIVAFALNRLTVRDEREAVQFHEAPAELILAFAMTLQGVCVSVVQGVVLAQNSSEYLTTYVPTA